MNLHTPLQSPPGPFGQLSLFGEEGSSALPAQGQDRTAICKAPAGKKYRIVHVDARDHELTVLGDYDGLNEVRLPLNSMIWPQRIEHHVFDTEGREVKP